MQSPNLRYNSIGEYRLTELLGAGGMGEVYRAVHTKINRVVAIKLLKNVSGSLIERARNEARIQANLHHQNIATLYDFLEWEGQPCLIMEYVDGCTLAEQLEARGRLAPAEALRIFQAVAEAVAYLHQHGVIHRDLKVHNIKLSSTGEVKLLDFGIAKDHAAPQLTMTGHVVGTLVCLAPEQLQGHADARSDVWALGVLLYHLVTGRLPFEAPSLDKLYEQIKKAAFVAPSLLNAAVPREVEALIARCLKKNPVDRYQSAAELLPELKRLNAPTPVKTISQSAPTSWKWFYAIAAVVLALVICAIIFWPTPATNSTATTTPAPLPITTISTIQENWRTIQIDVVDGRAEVYQHGQFIGATPHELRARTGDRIELELRRDGLVRQVEFSVTDNRRHYSYSVK
jgi:serine/threonine-protein kinase